MEVECRICFATFRTHGELVKHYFDEHSTKRRKRVGWGSGVALVFLAWLIQALPVSAATPDPMPSPLTAVFYHDADRDGIMGDNDQVSGDVAQ